MSDIPLPAEIKAWIDLHGWAVHHLEWHTERQWDLYDAAAQAQFAQMGWTRASRQEGAVGNGSDFLLMHRAMLGILREEFPQYSSWFLGWSSPPVDPSDPNDPSPNGPSDLFDPNMRSAIDRIHNALSGFGSEDVLGLYLETRLQPLAGQPRHRSPDATSGIHNYLHNRFSIPASEIDMGQPLKNLANARFWRLHGWIDNRWQAYREVAGLSDADPSYRDALAALKQHLRTLGGHVHHPLVMALAAAPDEAPRVVPIVPLSVLHPFRPTTARRFDELMESAPAINTREELIAYLQLAIQIEHGTLPLYLTALWSIKDPGGNQAAYDIIQSIALQEMLHMGTVCNLLVAIADKTKPAEMPNISRTPDTVPRFPGPVPGLDLSDVGASDVYLESLYSAPGDHKDRVRLFMRIELPEHPPLPLVAVIAIPRFKTIGEFYDVIVRGLDKLAGEGTIRFDPEGAGQLERQIDVDRLRKILSLADAKNALNLIKEQGEGMSDSQAPDPGADDVAHYYRFKELLVEQKYEKDAQGRWALNPQNRIPFPTADQVYAMASVPVQGYAQSRDFNVAYSEMLDLLQEAWDTGNAAKLTASVGKMRTLAKLAQALMKMDLPDGVGKLGPDFHYVPREMRSVTGERLLAGIAADAPKAIDYARVRQILDDAVQGQNIGAHGAFWRTLDRDQFVAKVVRGLKLIVTRPDQTFDPDESNLVKALEGRSPFGANLPTPPAGAMFNRMPDGFPPLPSDRIAEIRAWIGGGCPAVVPSTNLMFARGAEQPVDPLVHIEFWRDFDNWAAFNASDQTQADIDAFFAAAPTWMSLAKGGTGEDAWTGVLADRSLRDAITRLEQQQRKTVIRHYGEPVPLFALLDGFERFGDDSLPPDPLRPEDPRHRMNGRIMWFFWSAFVDAAIRLAGATPGPVEFWYTMARALLLGLINDGVFRGRFPVNGIAATTQGKVDARNYVRDLDVGALQRELQRRFRESGL